LSTDGAEAADLLSGRLLLYLLFLGVAPALFVTRIRIREERIRERLLSRSRLTLLSLAVMTGLVLISSAFYASFVREHKSLRYYMNPFTPLYAVYQLGKAHHTASGLPARVIGSDAEVPPADIHRELVIMVVGETARADRFSLNGYDRETNPELKREDVISFSRVASCGTSTAVSVPCMFSLYGRQSYQSHDDETVQNVLDVLNRAGVNLLWRDNNSNSKGVADRIRNEDFRSPAINPSCDEECRDEGMLTGLRDYIDSRESGDILIILHQMGSHGPAYYKRYPPEYRVFVPTCDSNQLQDCNESEINNAYDNTIVYTDHFLAGVIEFLRIYDDRFETAMLYASDHGESLGEAGMYLHGLPYWIAPDSQTHVPVIMWFGKNYDDIDVGALRRLKDEPMSHDNIFHTLLGLFEVSTGVYDGEKDLLQKSRKLAGTPPEF
jgi:lipid A ethanolaminephosphotransferase